MRILHRFLALGVLGAAFIMSSCILNSVQCEYDGSSMEGTWGIVSINGQPIPAAGYQLPTSTDRLTVGRLIFKRTSVECPGDGYDSESGTVVADYTLVTAAGAAKPSQTYAGSFSHGYHARRFSITANGRVSQGSNEPATELTSFGDLPNLGNLTVVFRRTQ